MITTFKLQQPMFGWSKGEQVTLDSDWGEWTRKRTGEVFNTRGSIAEGEVALILSYLAASKMTSVLAK